ncbi:hypothetical protein A33Q_1393 [Indibacter alkaliphilus LW1]|uniref:Uncharacterized protein n=1 Tax=Indibacter alkaliphilus (strain CCUG 57479 / KCTC 22604 / LW1) TaxID=1189612 RepID=S2DI97_INDAL|nr:hypothetical protein A33Q_1393 [Indibacter alkaliphilus LW1]
MPVKLILGRTLNCPVHPSQHMDRVFPACLKWYRFTGNEAISFFIN